MPRVTCNWIKDWINDEFKRIGIKGVQCNKVAKTRYNRDQYEGGAAQLNCYCNNTGSKALVDHLFLIFYPISYLNDAINNGHTLSFKYKSGNILDDEIHLIRK